MRVAFDAFWWFEGPQSNRMVQRELIRTWVRDFPDDQALVVVPARHRAAVIADVPPEVTVATTRLHPHGVAVAIDLPRLARRHRADITIAHNFTPLAGPSVTFIHDVLFQTNPEWFTRAERIYLAGIPLLARRAVVVATSSRTEAARIRTANPRLRRVTAIGLAMSPELRDSAGRQPAGIDGRPFLLTVSRLNVRKNLGPTISAALHSHVATPARPLVVVGESTGGTAALGPHAESARQRGAVVFLDHVDTAELAWLYANTDLFCYLSLDEGFGLPPVEAAGFGAPILASDIPVFRETVGDRARLVDPLDEAAISAAFASLLDHGRPPPSHPIDRYSWSASVRDLREVAVDAARSVRRKARR